jgi:hypothetical protein
LEINFSTYFSSCAYLIFITYNTQTLFRQQSLLFGKVCFLTVYAVILAFFFLPAGLFDDGKSTMIALESTYVVNEAEIPDMFISRRNIIRNNKALSRMAHVNPHVFCVDLALAMLELANQAYFDPGDYTTESGFGPIDLSDSCYEYFSHCHDDEHETVCCFFRHKVSSRIVVSFR